MSSYWEKVALGEICSFRRGVSYDGQTLKDAPDEGIPYINMKSFTKDGGYSPRGLKFFSGFYTTEDLLTKDDLVIANTDVTLAGDIIGAPAVPPKNLLEGPAVCSHHVTRLRPTANTSNTFLCHLLKHSQYRSVMRQHARGTTVQMLDPAAIKKIEVFIPSDKLEQARITEILDTLDTKIREIEALIAKLERIKQGLLTDLTTRGIDQNGQLRSTPDEASHLYKDSPLGRIPREWNAVTLASVSDMVTSGARDWARFYSKEGPKFIRIGNLTREHINFRLDSLIHVQPPQDGEGQRTRLKVGDVLISITADLGIIAVVSEGIGEAYINQHIALVRPRREALNARFLGHLVASPTCQKFISTLNDAGAKSGLNLPTVRNILVVVPERREQDEIQRRLDAIDSRIQGIKTEAAKLRLEKVGLLDDLLTGRVRVTPLLEAKEQATT